MSTGRRHDIRLPDFDYSEPGIYHVTITLKNRIPIFGEVAADGIQLSSIGAMIEKEWQELPNRFPWVSLDVHIVMPDHLHGLLVLGSDPAVIDRVKLGQIIGAYKSITTVKYGEGVRKHGWPRYAGKFWTENYFERVVRKGELDRIRNYLLDNPYRYLAKQ